MRIAIAGNNHRSILQWMRKTIYPAADIDSTAHFSFNIRAKGLKQERFIKQNLTIFSFTLLSYNYNLNVKLLRIILFWSISNISEVILGGINVIKYRNNFLSYNLIFLYRKMITIIAKLISL